MGHNELAIADVGIILKAVDDGGRVGQFIYPGHEAFDDPDRLGGFYVGVAADNLCQHGHLTGVFRPLAGCPSEIYLLPPASVRAVFPEPSTSDRPRLGRAAHSEKTCVQSTSLSARRTRAKTFRLSRRWIGRCRAPFSDPKGKRI